MLQFLISSVIESYRAPRSAVRRVIDRVNGIEDIAIIFALSFTLQALMLAFSELLIGDAEQGLGNMVVGSLLISAISFALVVGLVFGVGRLFGGEGTLQDVGTAVAWHSLVTVIFAPFLGGMAIGGAEQIAINPFRMAIFLIVFWLFVNFVAEAHKFASAWRVAGAMFGAIMVTGLVLSILVAGSISVP